MNKKISRLVLVSLLIMPLVASAQADPNDPYGVNAFLKPESKLNIGTKKLEATIAGIINIVLGFLGILATLLILYGGFIWMTSEGSSDKITKAKGIIGAGVVGLVIIFAAYSIARFVLGSLKNTATL
jgi:hypothetical protein